MPSCAPLITFACGATALSLLLGCAPRAQPCASCPDASLRCPQPNPRVHALLETNAPEPGPARASEPPLVPFELPVGDAQRVSTSAGLLEISEQEGGCAYRVSLGDRPLLTTNCKEDADPNRNFPIPLVRAHFAPGPAPFDEVVVVQQGMLGSACSGGPIWFLGVKGGVAQMSGQIDFCGGRDLVIRAEPTRVVVFLPGGPPNRGTGYIPSETWAFESGHVRQLGPAHGGAARPQPR